jgi:hypothetical protein
MKTQKDTKRFKSVNGALNTQRLLFVKNVDAHCAMNAQKNMGVIKNMKELLTSISELIVSVVAIISSLLFVLITILIVFSPVWLPFIVLIYLISHW